MIIFAAFGGLFLNFLLLLQQNAIVVLVLVMEYQQAFLQLRFNRRRLRKRPWAWTLPRPVESWFEIHFHRRTIPAEYFRQQLRMGRETFQALVGVRGPCLTKHNTRFRDYISPEKLLA